MPIRARDLIDAVPIQKGGTGAADAETARTNLGLDGLATVGDAPSDGGQYVRKDGAWVAVSAGGAAAAFVVEIDLGSTAKSSGSFTIADAAILATSKVICWQAPGPYTGKGTLADEAAMQPIQVMAVAVAIGLATVYWQTPPAFVAVPALNYGRVNPAGATFDRLMNQRDVSALRNRRVGMARGNVKFCYSIFG